MHALQQGLLVEISFQAKARLCRLANDKQDWDVLDRQPGYARGLILGQQI
jgi:hypothetical protein